MPAPTNFTIRDKHGATHTLYYKERLSAVSGVPVHTLTLWDKCGILPSAPFRDNVGRKLYHADHITAFDEVLTAELTACGICDINKERLRDALRERFKQVNASLAQKFKGAENYETQKNARKQHRVSGSNARG